MEVKTRVAIATKPANIKERIKGDRRNIGSRTQMQHKQTEMNTCCNVFDQVSIGVELLWRQFGTVHTADNLINIAFEIQQFVLIRAARVCSGTDQRRVYSTWSSDCKCNDVTDITNNKSKGTSNKYFFNVMKNWELAQLCSQQLENYRATLYYKNQVPLKIQTAFTNH